MLSLKAKPRDILGKKVITLRKQGIIPAVLYGPKTKGSISISIKDREFEKLWNEAGETSLIDLEIEGSKKHTVLIHSIAYNPVSDKPIHVDFYEIDQTKPIHLNIPLEFIGEVPIIKEEGGVLLKLVHEIEVEALPSKLPHELKIDLSKLKTYEDKITTSDISLPEGVSALSDKDLVIAFAEPPRVAEEITEEEEKASIEGIEVVGEKEKEEEKATQEGEAKIKEVEKEK